MFWISLIFFFSGLSALVYQLLWMRHLGFVFGNTVYASATVLTAFMGGLAIGSHIFGRIAEKLRNPVRGFAILEFIVAAYALALPFLFSLIRSAYTLAYRHVSDDLLFLTALRFVLALIVLLIPCICMGGTLPVLIRGLARDDRSFGLRLGWLYGVNTLGAVAGVLLSGFYLIPTIGLSHTNFIAAMTDAVAGLGALLIASNFIIHDPTAGAAARKFHWPDISPRAKWAVAVATVCGFSSLVLEVVWFRALILVFGSTTYSFTVMLAVFLLGIGAGSLLIAPFLDRVRNLAGLLATLITAIGLYTLWSMYRFDQGPEFLLKYLLSHDFTWWAMNSARFMIAVSHLAVPALLFGASFTLATRLIRHENESSSRTVGFVYAINTIGAVGGSFVGGFMLLPSFGMEKSLLLVALSLIGFGILSAVFLVRSMTSRVISLALFVAVVMYLYSYPPNWDKSMLSAGAYFGPFNFVRDNKIILRERVIADRLLHYEEALSSTVSVHKGDNEKLFFCVDGKTEADQTPRSMVLQRMIGHLPLLFHPDAKKAVNIGLGAGVSFGAMSQHPLDHFEVVEVEPAVKYAAELWGELNHWVVDNPRAILTFNDGRNHLLSTTNKYDVITADPFEPIVAGASHLYTVDYFRIAHDRLNKNGIMGQFLPLYEMSLDDYLTIARSFVEVFPRSSIFFTGLDTILIGFKGQVALDAGTLRRNYEVPSVKKSLSNIGFTSPEMILAMFVADLSVKTNFTASGPVNTDNLPIIEYSVPRHALYYAIDVNQRALLDNFTPIPDAWLEGLDDDTVERLVSEHQAVELMLKASVARANNDIDNAFALLKEAHQASPESPVVKNELVAMLSSSGLTRLRLQDKNEAKRLFQLALTFDSGDFWSMYHLITLLMSSGETVAAANLLDHAESIYPESPLVMGQRAKFLFSVGYQREGLDMIVRAVKYQPNNRGLWIDLSNLAKIAGDELLIAYAHENLDRINAYINE